PRKNMKSKISVFLGLVIRLRYNYGGRSLFLHSLLLALSPLLYALIAFLWIADGRLPTDF
ncbi:MAG: hypothetical protein KAT38_06525, partial [Bacteroidales bacterium]|nr:hypothetical protein [Bacteroidales bacterium]